MAESIPERFRAIAARFRRIDSPDDATAERMVRAAGASAAQCFKAGIEAGAILNQPGCELQWPSPPDRMINDQTSEWYMLWSAIALSIHRNFPSELSSNPVAIRITSGTAPGIGIGMTDKRDWRFRAENFAELCDFISERVESAEKPKNPRSKLPENADAMGLMNHLRATFQGMSREDVTQMAVNAANSKYWATRPDIKESEYATLKRYAREGSWYWKPE